MKMLEYSFLLELSWSKFNGFEENFSPRAKFCVNFNYAEKYGWVNFHILESLFTCDKKLKDIKWVNVLINNIEKVINNELEFTGIHCETGSLQIKKDYSRPIDNLDTHGSNPPVDGSNSWNQTTPNQLQYIPTNEILTLFKDWRTFLEEQKTVTFKQKGSL